MSNTDSAQPIDIHSLYANHHGWLHGWLRQKVGCSETAADLAHDTFMRILLKDITPRINKPRAYLGTIAQGLMFNHWRHQALKQAYMEWLGTQPEPLTPSLEEQHLVIETLLQLGQILDGLPQRSKQVFLLARLDGLSYQHIAERLGITVNMVQKAMTLAMHNCYRVLYV